MSENSTLNAMVDDIDLINDPGREETSGDFTYGNNIQPYYNQQMPNGPYGPSPSTGSPIPQHPNWVDTSNFNFDEFPLLYGGGDNDQQPYGTEEGLTRYGDLDHQLDSIGADPGLTDTRATDTAAQQTMFPPHPTLAPSLRTMPHQSIVPPRAMMQPQNSMPPPPQATTPQVSTSVYSQGHPQFGPAGGAGKGAASKKGQPRLLCQCTCGCKKGFYTPQRATTDGTRCSKCKNKQGGTCAPPAVLAAPTLGAQIPMQQPSTPYGQTQSGSAGHTQLRNIIPARSLLAQSGSNTMLFPAQLSAGAVVGGGYGYSSTGPQQGAFGHDQHAFMTPPSHTLMDTSAMQNAPPSHPMSTEGQQDMQSSQGQPATADPTVPSTTLPSNQDPAINPASNPQEDAVMKNVDSEVEGLDRETSGDSTPNASADLITVQATQTAGPQNLTSTPTPQYQPLFQTEDDADAFLNGTKEVRHVPLNVVNDDAAQVTAQQKQAFCSQIFDAILENPADPPASWKDEEKDAYRSRQTDALKQCKTLMDTNEGVKRAIARCDKVYYAAQRLHSKGIPEYALQPGKNGGFRGSTISRYTVDWTSKFTVRMLKVIAAVKGNKRVAIDVLTAKKEQIDEMVWAPEGYWKRKLENFGVNEGKSGDLKQATAKRRQANAVQDGQGGAAVKKGKRGKRAIRQSLAATDEAEMDNSNAADGSSLGERVAANDADAFETAAPSGAATTEGAVDGEYGDPSVPATGPNLDPSAAPSDTNGAPFPPPVLGKRGRSADDQGSPDKALKHRRSSKDGLGSE